jgi:energy-coupling factor transport system substrate-specific component
LQEKERDHHEVRKIRWKRNGSAAPSARRIAVTLLTLQPAGFAAAGGDAPNASGVANRPIAVDPSGHSEGYSAVLYNNRSGLPTSEANAIAETSEGFLWIGSYAGLIRFDGTTFDRVDSTTGITSVMCLYVDRQDRLWIGTNANGVAVMERGEYRIWSLADGLNSASIRAITEDLNGLIYVASTAGLSSSARTCV